jgi:hypothetical protein
VKKTWRLLIIAGALSTLCAASSAAETKTAVDRCLTTLYNYPAETQPARASIPLVTLEAKAPIHRPGNSETSAIFPATGAKPSAAGPKYGIFLKIQ